MNNLLKTIKVQLNKNFTEKVSLNKISTLKWYVILFIIFSLVPHRISAQCIMTGSNVSSSQMVAMDDLFNISINCQSEMICRIELDIVNEKGLLLANCKTQEFKIPKIGTLIINMGNISMLKPYDITLAQINEITTIIKSQEILPEGKYHLRYRLYGKGAEQNFNILNDYNDEITIQLNVPPYILTPMCEKSTVFGKQFFSWTPAFSMIPDRVFTYNIQIMEILDKQTKEIAVRNNAPVLSVRNIIGNTYQMDAYEEQLLSIGNCYAWFIEVLSDNIVIQKSDICEFCNLDEKPERVPARPYIDIRQSSKSKIFPVIEGKVYFMYTEDYSVGENEELKLKLFSDERKKDLKIDTEPFKVKTGKNYYYFDVCKDRDLRPGLYILEMTNSKGEIFRVKFNKSKEYRCE